MFTKRIVCILVYIVAGALLEAQAISGSYGGPISLDVLREQADVIAIGAIEEISTSSALNETGELRVVRILQGQPSASLIAVNFAPPLGWPVPKEGFFPKALIGTTGIWFLKAASNGNQVLPIYSKLYTGRDFFLPKAYAPETFPGGSISQQLLAYLVQWYRALPQPNSGDEIFLFSSLAHANRNEGLAATNVLIGSPVLEHQAVGITAAIRLGSDDAVIRLGDELQALQSNKRFMLVLDALEVFYHPQNGDASIPPLDRLRSLGANVPGIDNAVSSALQKIGTKAVIPIMAKLLDSGDSRAQLRAASFFGYLTLFADSTGHVPGTGVTRAFGNFRNTPVHTTHGFGNYTSAICSVLEDMVATKLR